MHNILSLDNLYYVKNHPNPFAKYGNKFTSQTDEDGFTIEIVRRINPTNKTFLELGVGDGMENNTFVLQALGWQGQWIGGEDLVIAFPNYTKAWITKENVISLINVDPTFLSIDLDGNDFHILDTILAVYSPQIIVVEYNAVFPPPIEFVLPYNSKHGWDGTDWFGASLQSYVNLLSSYKLIVCNPTSGANAFFVHKKYADLFPEVPQLVRDIFVPPRYSIQNTEDNRHQRSFGVRNYFI